MLVIFQQWQGFSQNLSVYPGDVTDNGVVNNVDFLHLGLAYNFFGPQRDTVIGNGLGFVPQPAYAWPFQFANGTNFAFADCNGDGVVNYFYDAFPIYVNYGLQRDTGVSPDLFVPGLPGIDPMLKFDGSALPGELHPGMSFTLPITLGDAQMPVEDLYGVAFSVIIDPLYIDANDVSFNFTQPSWANPDGDRIYMYKKVSDERIDVAWVRTDHNSVNGFGTIGVANFYIIIIDVIGYEQDVPIRIESIRMIDHFGNETLVAGDTLMLHIVEEENQQTDTQSPEDARLRIWPNPASDYLHIHADFEIQQLMLVNALGQPVIRLGDPGEAVQLPLAGLPAGMYVLELQSPGGVLTRTIRIQK
ncbi:MAG: T9SS type A sorting domain-containing protein [Lewinellaceae bacterium]|nr:T9SS type A sorting domain-containing protein [Lewinellaceae bacterium]